MNSPHGTRARYNYRGCRCAECTDANAAYQRERKAKGPGFVSPDGVASHIRELARAGVGTRAIADACDLNRRSLCVLARGGRSKVQARVALRVLAVDQSALADSALVSAAETQGLIRNLIGRGYTKRQLAEWLGYQSTSLQLWRKRITARNAVAVERLYKLIDAGKIRSDWQGAVFAVRKNRLRKVNQ